MYKNIIKRLFDSFAAFIGLIILSPIFIIIVILLFFANKGKPFFFQPRPGKDGKIFNIVKFKSMNDRTDNDGNLLPMGERITKIGAFVRKTSLDELPQLINVLRGEMSLIGPRPLLVEYLEMYTPVQSRRHTVRPGVTGWAQVNGRNLVTWKEKFEMDVWYVDNISFKLDCIIIIKTIRKLVFKSGIAPIELKVKQSDFLE